MMSFARTHRIWAAEISSATLKNFVAKHYTSGKRDLYAAFILRCCEWADHDAYVAMVTQQSWMFLRSFVELRTSSARQPTNGGLLVRSSIEVLAHLGRYAFSEITNALVAPVLFSLRQHHPGSKHRLWASRLTTPRPAGEQAMVLQDAARTGIASGIVSTPYQSDLSLIPESPIAYWLNKRFFRLLQTTSHLKDVADACAGMQTSDNDRFLRYFWEVRDYGVVTQARPISGRWFLYSKGGRYQKWAGMEWLVIDWENAGDQIRTFERSFIRNENKSLFHTGLTYTEMGNGTQGTRLMRHSIFDVKGMSIFPKGATVELIPLAGSLSTHLCSYLLRVTTQNIEFHAGYVANLPMPSQSIAGLAQPTGSCIALKSFLVSRDPIEYTFF